MPLPFDCLCRLAAVVRRVRFPFPAALKLVDGSHSTGYHHGAFEFFFAAMEC